MNKYKIAEKYCCGTCIHFHRHFVRRGEGFYALSWGHCVYPRIKNRDVTATCAHWKARNKEKAVDTNPLG